MTKLTESIEARNERGWAEFEAQSKQLEADHQQTMARIHRRYEFQRRLIYVVLVLQVVTTIIFIFLAPTE